MKRFKYNEILLKKQLINELRISLDKYRKEHALLAPIRYRCDYLESIILTDSALLSEMENELSTIEMSKINNEKKD